MSRFEDEIVSCLPHLRAFAWRLSRGRRDLADDLVQETAEKALRGRANFAEDSEVRPWLFGIMKNVWSQRRKGAGLWESLEEHDVDAEEKMAWNVFPGNVANLLLDDAMRLLSSLPDDQRDAIVLTCVYGMSVDDAAAKLGVRPGTVKSRIFRARERMAAVEDESGLPPRARR